MERKIDLQVMYELTDRVAELVDTSKAELIRFFAEPDEGLGQQSEPLPSPQLGLVAPP